MTNNNFTINEKLAQISWSLRKARMRSARGEGGWKDPDAWRKRLLGFIQIHPGMTLQEIAKGLSHRMPAAEEVLLGLESKGYITLTPMDTGDGKRVALTELGEKEAMVWQDNSNAFDVLSDEEKEVFIGYLSRIAESLQQKTDCDEDGDGFPWAGDFHRHWDMDMEMEHMRKWQGPFGRGFRDQCPEDFRSRDRFGGEHRGRDFHG